MSLRDRAERLTKLVIAVALVATGCIAAATALSQNPMDLGLLADGLEYFGDGLQMLEDLTAIIAPLA